MLQNENLLAKIGADTAENEPSKVRSFGWKIRSKIQYRIFQLSVGHAGPGRVLVRQEPEEGGVLLCLEPLEAFPGVPFRLEGIEVRVREGQGRETEHLS